MEEKVPARSIPNLTILRYPLAIWVILHHTIDFRIFKALETPPKILVTLVETGNQATTVFFILSGFVICHSWIRNKEQSVLKFYRKRFLSLYPFYLVCLVSIYISDFDRNNDKSLLLSNIFGLQPFFASRWFTINGPSWSLGVEFILYLLFPLLLSPIRKIKSYKVALLILVGIEFLFFGIITSIANDASAFYILYHFPPFQLFHFIEGILCFFIYMNSEKRVRGSKVLSLLTLSGLIILAIQYSHSTSVSTLKYGILLVIPTILLILNISIADKFEPIKQQGFINKILQRAGETTFLLYISHWAWIGLLRYLLTPVSNVFVMLALLLSLIVIATFLAYLIQRKAVVTIATTGTSTRQKIQALFVTVTLLVSLTTSNSLFPRQWTVQTLNIKDALEVKVLAAEQDAASGLTTLKAEITNLAKESRDVSYCYVLIRNPKVLSQDQKNPVRVEMKGQIGGQDNALVNLKFVMPLGNSEKFDEFIFSGTCE